MQPEIIVLVKSERQIPYDITYMWNLKHDTNEPIYGKKKNKIKDTREQIVDCQGGKGWERGGVGVWG